MDSVLGLILNEIYRFHPRFNAQQKEKVISDSTPAMYLQEFRKYVAGMYFRQTISRS